MGIHAQEDPSGNWRWAVQDALSSLRGEVDAALAMQGSRGFSPYGEVFGAQGAFASPYAFTGEAVDANGLLYLRARYYAPGMGRFFQTDPSRQEMNPYLYATSHPITLTDPSGHFPICPSPVPWCEGANEVDSDDRDLTDWLVRTMVENAASLEVSDIRSLNVSGNFVAATVGMEVAEILAEAWICDNKLEFTESTMVTGATAGSLKLAAFLKWADLVKDGARWDFKDAILFEMEDSIRLCDDKHCQWYEYSTPGNIHYAYVGRAAGFSGFELHAGATYAQQTDPENIPWQNAWHGDQPSDYQAIELGIKLYQACNPLTVSCFQYALRRYGLWLNRAKRPDDSHFNETYGTNYPTWYFDGGG